MNRVVTRLGFTTLAIVAGVAAHAQTVTTGALMGVVKGDKGGAVAGATVTLTSGQGSRTATTQADGTFRAGLLNPGEYQISVSKDGFSTFKGKVSIQVNNTATVNVTLPTAASQVVEVVATSVNLDFTANQTGLTTSMTNLESVPKARDVNQIVFLAPGVVDSGRLGGASIAGASALENQYFVDGVNTTDQRKGFQGAAMPTDFVDQVEVQTGGFKPEFSALGGVFNVTTKSGTNEFAGTGWFNYDANQIRAVAKSNTGVGDTINGPISYSFRQGKPNDRFDVGFSAGGAIIKDKLFYFVGGNVITEKAPDSLPNLIGLVNGEDKTTTTQAYGKINWMVNSDQQLTFTAQVNNVKRDAPTAYPTIGDAQWGFNVKNDHYSFGVGYDWTINPNLFLSVKATHVDYKDTTTPTNMTDPRVQDQLWGANHYPGLVNYGTNFERGGFGLNEDLNQFTQNQIRVDLSWFLGSHNLKFGVSSMNSDYKLVDRASGPQVTPFVDTAGTLASYTSGFRAVFAYSSNVAYNPTHLRRIDLVFNANNSKVKSQIDAFYAQDTWEVFGGFRLAYGFRYEPQSVTDNFGHKALKFDNFSDIVQPRIGLTWDLNNDGRTKVSANYGRFFFQIPMQPVMRTGGTEVYIRNRWDNAVRAGAASYDPVTGVGTVTGNPTSITDFSLFFSAPPLADGTKLTQRDEYVLGVDHQLPNGWVVGLKGKHRELKNPIEDSVLTDRNGAADETTPGHGDSAGYSILWNPHPGRVTWTAGALSSVQGQKLYAEGDYNLFPRAFNTYDSVEFTAEKKTSTYYVGFNYTWSRLYGNYEGVGQSSNGQADALITSTFDYWPYVGYGLLPIDRTNVVKLFGSYTLDLAGNPFTAGFKVVYQSGTPVTLFDDGSTTQGLPPGSGSSLDIGGYGNAVPANFNYGGYGRTPNTTVTDLTFEYGIKMGAKVKITPSINVFNVFNTRTATSVNPYATDANGNPTGSFGQENGWLAGRNYRWGVRVNF